MPSSGPCGGAGGGSRNPVHVRSRRDGGGETDGRPRASRAGDTETAPAKAADPMGRGQGDRLAVDSRRLASRRESGIGEGYLHLPISCLRTGNSSNPSKFSKKPTSAASAKLRMAVPDRELAGRNGGGEYITTGCGRPRQGEIRPSWPKLRLQLIPGPILDLPYPGAGDESWRWIDKSL